MEMFKNWNDKPYLIVIAVLTVISATVTFLGVATIESVIEGRGIVILLILLTIFFVLATIIFSLLYPFHLLRTDYKNRVMSLIFASGVSRGKYYFVKISATIFCCLLALLVIFIVPMVTFLIIYADWFAEAFRFFVAEFSTGHIFLVTISQILGLLASLVILTTSVIITRGKVAGIFLYLGFMFGLSIVSYIVQLPVLLSTDVSLVSGFIQLLYIGMAMSVVHTIGFVLLGLYIMKRQNL